MVGQSAPAGTQRDNQHPPGQWDRQQLPGHSGIVSSRRVIVGIIRKGNFFQVSFFINLRACKVRDEHDF